jgi:hypothetical protein
MVDESNKRMPFLRRFRLIGMLVIVLGILVVIWGSCTMLLLLLPGVSLGPKN